MDKEMMPAAQQGTSAQGGGAEFRAGEFRAFEMLESMTVPIFTHNDVHAEISSVSLPIIENIGLSEVSTDTDQQNSQNMECGGADIVLANAQGSFINSTDNANVDHGLTVEDALSYLDRVRMRFMHQPQIYLSFIDIMRDFKTQTIDTLGVIYRINELLHDEPDLLSDFKVFLPDDFQWTTELTAPVSVTTTNELENANVNVGTESSLIVSKMATVTESSTTPPPSRQYSSHEYESFHVSPTTMIATESHHVEQAPIALVHQSNNRQENDDEQMLFQVMHHHRHDNEGNFASELGNHPDYEQAIDYVNEIKSRLSVEEYQQFLEILSVYRKQQRFGSSNLECNLTEEEICVKISKLFEGHVDLIEGFVRIVPTSASVLTPIVMSRQSNNQENVETPSTKNNIAVVRGRRQVREATTGSPKHFPEEDSFPKKTESSTNVVRGTTAKKLKLIQQDHKPKAKSLGFEEFAEFLNKVQRLKPSSRYEDFLRVLFLHNKDVLSQSELLQTVADLLGDETEMLTWFKNFVAPVSNESPDEPENAVSKEESNCKDQVYDIRELDPSACRRLGQSYCQAPKNFHLPKCSGRTSLCDEVLNDEWLSVPIWTESAACISSKKLPTEERANQVEDQRFELDFVIQTNAEAIKYLRVVDSSMNKMSPKERDEFQLDERLGSQSTIHLRAVKRIYGDVAAAEIIEGLIRCPKVAVPIVLKRLERKDEEWRAEQGKFNKVWREQLERYYSKQGSSFKQRDIKALRTKSLLAEIQTKNV